MVKIQLNKTEYKFLMSILKRDFKIFKRIFQNIDNPIKSCEEIIKSKEKLIKKLTEQGGLK